MKKKVLLFLCAIMMGGLLATIPARALTYGNYFISGTSNEASSDNYKGAAASISYYSKPYVPSQTFSCAWVMIFAESQYNDASLAQVGWVVDNKIYSDNIPRYFFGYAQNTKGSFVSRELDPRLSPIQGAADGYKVIHDNSAYPNGGYADVIGYINGISYWSAKINWTPTGVQYAGEATSTDTQFPGKNAKHEIFSDVKIYNLGSTGTPSWVYPGTLIWDTDTNGAISNSSFMYNHSFEILDTRY